MGTINIIKLEDIGGLHDVRGWYYQSIYCGELEMKKFKFDDRGIIGEFVYSTEWCTELGERCTLRSNLFGTICWGDMLYDNLPSEEVIIERFKEAFEEYK